MTAAIAKAITEFSTQAEAQQAANSLANSALVVVDKQVEIVEEAPPPPYDTATLLEDAANILHWNSERTMQTAQALFEGILLYGAHTGLITYHRTDSQHVAPEAQTAARTVLEKLYGKGALPPAPPPGQGNLSPTPWWQNLLPRPTNQHATIGGCKHPLNQQSHEAIRPTEPARMPDSLLFYLDADGQLLYRLIWERFIASQMKAAKYQVTTVALEPLLPNFSKLDKSTNQQKTKK